MRSAPPAFAAAMFLTLKLLLGSLLTPPAGPLLLAIAGAWLLWVGERQRGRTAGGWLLAAGLAASWLLATPWVADALSRAAEREPPLDLARAMQAQAIVILGGGDARLAAPEYGGAAAPGGELLERVAYAALIAQRTGLPVLATGTAPEALAMRAALARNFGVGVRWLDERSHDTFENALNSARLLKAAGVSRIVLVTSGAHAWRATREFESAGLEVVPAPAGMVAARESGLARYLPGPAALGRSSAALHELIGEVARRALAALGLRRQAA